MNDMFQFYESSADLAPGRGAGETLTSASDTYSELKKVKGWRRVLAASEAAKTLSKEAEAILPLTQSAELWYAPGGNKKARVQATFLTSKRTSPEQPTEETMEVKPRSKNNNNKKEKQKEGNLGAVPEGLLATPALVEAEAASPVEAAEAEAEAASAIRFCPVCRYYLYLEVSGEEQILNRLCRNCGHREEDTKGGMVMEMMVQERSAEGYKILLNEFTRQDPRLPHIRKNIKCPEPTCDSNHGKREPDIIYIKYDAVNMLYLYICDICGFQWRSAR
jgi:DNA-directed RNA polymerase subunit M/transcription elongation factor TFIIS